MDNLTTTSPNAEAGWMRQMRQTFQMRKFVAALFLVLIAGLLTVDGLLLRQDRRLHRTLERQAASLSPRAGITVPPLRGVSMDGRPLSIGYAGDPRKTLLFVFSTECPMCDLNWPRWEVVTSSIDSKQYRLVYANVSNSLNPAYVEKHHLNGATLFAKVDPSAALTYMLTLVPAVYLVGPDARVERVWLGMLEDAECRAMQRALAAGPAPSG